MLVSGSIGQSEHVPRAPHRQPVGPREQTEPTDRVVRTLELEEERCPGRECPERCATRSPEVDLGDLRSCAEELIPAVVGGRDEAVHRSIVANRTGPCNLE